MVGRRRSNPVERERDRAAPRPFEQDDVEAALARLLDMGATQHEAPRDRGEKFITATVIDPFGNILGIMENPHYLEVLRATKPS